MQLLIPRYGAIFFVDLSVTCHAMVPPKHLHVSVRIQPDRRAQESSKSISVRLGIELPRAQNLLAYGHRKLTGTFSVDECSGASSAVIHKIGGNMSVLRREFWG